MTCTAATPTLSEEEIRERLLRLDGWSKGEAWIERRFRFKSFLRTMSFVNAVAYLAESVNHHPEIVIHYNEVTLRNLTHAAGGVTEHDFLLAKKIVELFETGNSL